jgi:hypothetical protein
MPDNGVMAEVTAADEERVRRRYPRRTGLQRALVVTAALLTVVGLVWLGWAAWIGSHPAIAAHVRSFTVESDTAVSVTLAVERADPGSSGSCDVIVQAESYERVGELTVDIPPSDKTQVLVTVEVKTFKRGTSASLGDCRVLS